MTFVSAVNTFSLREGVTAAQFEEFSRKLDRPTCLAFEQVKGFEVYFVEGEIDKTIDVIEVMTVTSWPEWIFVRDSAPELKTVVEKFDELVNPDTVTTYFTRRSPQVEEN